MTDAPDYLKEAEAAIRRDPLSHLGDVVIPPQSFSELQNENRDELLRILTAALSVPNGTIRKSAAFALGQVGDERVLNVLVEARETETARGNIEAIDAAIAVLESMSLSSGSTEAERRKAVENSYFGRPLGSSSPSPYSQTSTPKTSGCFSILLMILISLVIALCFFFPS